MLTVRVVVPSGHLAVREILDPLVREARRMPGLSLNYVHLSNDDGSRARRAFQRAFVSPADVLVIDGHGEFRAEGSYICGVDLGELRERSPMKLGSTALAIGACDAASPVLDRWLRIRRTSPTALLACHGKASYPQGGAIWSALFPALSEAAGSGRPWTPSTARSLFDRVLRHVALDGRLKLDHWVSRVR